MKTFYQNNLGLIQLGLHFGHCICFSWVLDENTQTRYQQSCWLEKKIIFHIRAFILCFESFHHICGLFRKPSLRGVKRGVVHNIGYFVCLSHKPKCPIKMTGSLMWQKVSTANGETSSRVKSHLVLSEVNVQGFVIDGFRTTRGPVYTVHLLGEFL